MKIRTMALLLALPLAAGCGSDEAGKQDKAAGDNPEQASAADPEAEAAFTKLLACNALTGSAYSLIGGETMFAEGDEKTALVEIETALRARKNELQPRMEADGAALGLTPDAITERFNQAQSKHVHGPGMGTRLEYARKLAEDSDTCAAALPKAEG